MGVSVTITSAPTRTRPRECVYSRDNPCIPALRGIKGVDWYILSGLATSLQALLARLWPYLLLNPPATTLAGCHSDECTHLGSLIVAVVTAVSAVFDRVLCDTG